ncbi:hypothetical protein GO755_35565 [Spirosoma sp. HMF4905]|uniref:Uncharacterized protein n=1 Tax=Spirosoma arboris TaxID=2682092 RepID=A0A7K1SNK9_9BACT|nr:hypothetical protein [Spirosoma arboris]MVM35394.1 hypothetical protein [Spirosoma arboris]
MPESYDRKIRLPGLAEHYVYAKLTYTISPHSSSKRQILLVPYNRKWLSPELFTPWETLLKETNLQPGGNFAQDKFLVNRIRTSPHQFPQLGVAIHHFGPVPVLMTGYTIPQKLHGETIQAQVALYNNRPGDAYQQFRGMFPTTLFFLQSLTGDYDIIMQRYFEDVAHLLADIAITSSLSDAFAWGKQAEDTIGQSIQSKLRESVPTITDWAAFDKRFQGIAADEVTARCLLFQEHDNNIFEAQYFRNTALYFLNELYRHLGLESRSDEYLARFPKLASEYDALLGQGTAAQLIEYNADLHQLQQIRVQYLNDDFDGLRHQHSSIVWLQGLITFGTFLLNLNRNGVEPTKGRVFISFNYGVSVSEHLKEQIKSYYRHHHPADIEVLTVEGLRADTYFRDVIQPRIWQCDRMLVIVPRRSSKLGQEQGGSYEWLIKEAEYAIFLGKSVTFLLERGYDRSHWDQVMRDEHLDLLSPQEGDKLSRLRKLEHEFNTRVFVEFSVSGDTPFDQWEDLNAQMQDMLEHNTVRATALRHHNMAKGFLSQFTKNNLLTIQCLYSLLSAGQPLLSEGQHFTKDEAVDLLYSNFGRSSHLPFHTKGDCQKVFVNTWNQVKERSFTVGSRSFTVLEPVTREGQPITDGSRHSHYMLSLEKLLRALQPSISKERLETWAQNLLKEVLQDKEEKI